MSEDDIPERVTRLERQMVEVRQDAVAARVLAGGADRDVSGFRAELNAHREAPKALRETQLDQYTEMREGFADVRAEMREGFADVRAEMRSKFTEMDNGFAEMREGFAKTAVGMAQITAILTSELGKPDCP